ncbi:hypothetical protein [Methylocystis parvus]|uniref:hypothetical protein n=1 Tax=Methylocystis parvus TaxID=134 RepID=UPI003C70EEB9
MPRLGISINDSFDRRPRAPQPDAYGRRPRQVSGVRVVGEREKAPLFASVFLKVTTALALVAIASMSLAIWRLFSFHH